MLFDEIPNDGVEPSLQLLKADIKFHRANGEWLYGDFDNALRDHKDAQSILLQCAFERASLPKLSEATQIPGE